MRHADFPAPADVVDAHLEKLVPATPAAALGARVLRVATNPHLTGAPGCAVFTTIIIYIMAICLGMTCVAICLGLLQSPTGTCQQEESFFFCFDSRRGAAMLTQSFSANESRPLISLLDGVQKGNT